MAASTEETAAASTEETAAASTEETGAPSTEETGAPSTEETAAASTEETPEVSTEEDSEIASEANDDSTEINETGTETWDESSIPAGKLEYQGPDYQVILTYDDKAGIPERASLQVTEIDKDSKEYKQYLEAAGEALKMHRMASPKGRFFEIKIMNDDQEFRPKAPVSLNITYDQPMEVEAGQKVDALRFGEKTAKVIENVKFGYEKEFSQGIEPESEKEQDQKDKDSGKDDQDQTVRSLTFEADAFSVYGLLIYRVDYTFDGYSYSIAKNSTVKLSQLAETLGIAGEEKYYKTGADFVKEVEDVTCSDDSFLEVSKAGWFGTGFFSGGDWELISRKSFDT